MNFVSEVEFQQCECQEFCIRVADGTHGTPLQSDFGKKLVTSKNIRDGRLSLDNAYLISNEDFDEINRRSKVEQWDILLSMIGTVGEVCLVDAPEPDFAIKNVGLLKCGDKNRAKWLYYFLRSSAGRQLIEKRKKGTAQQHIALGEIRRLPIPFPSVAGYMKTVTDLLSVFDDRITLLRETNATLEATAQALFKSWFVDFDPVHAKQQGLAPEGMDEATAALFPDSFEDSELGLIPKGWRVGKISDLGHVVCGKTPPTAQPENYGDDVPFITIPDMHDKLTVTSTNRLLSRLGAETQRNKYLPPGAVCVSCIGTPGLVVRVTTEAQTNQRINSVIPFDKFRKSFPLFLLRRIGNAVRAGGSGGSVFPNLNKSGFEEIKVLLSSEPLADKFDDIAEPMVTKIICNQIHAQTLATLRDTLLPRLISGQLRLPEAEAS